MTNTYKTLNPLGSNNARDLSDNASNFDEYMNSDLPSIKDRFDKRRETLAGNQVAFDDAQEGRAQEFTEAQAERESEFNTDQSERDTAFQAFLEGTGWSSIGAYGAGVVITSHTHTVDYLGQPYALKPSIPASIESPYITTGNWPTDGVNFKLVGDNALRQEVSIGIGSSDFKFSQSGLGAVAQTITEAMRGQKITPQNFGGIFDGTLHPLSERFSTVEAARLAYPGVWITGLDKSIDYAATQAAILACHKTGNSLGILGVGGINDELIIYKPILIEGNGPGWGYNTQSYNQNSGFKFFGSGTKRIRTRSKYRASASDPQDDPVSVGINIQAANTILRDFSITLNGWGVNPGEFGDDWDCGVFSGCRLHVKFQNFHASSGHWRKAGIYIDVTQPASSSGAPRFSDPFGVKFEGGPHGSDGLSFVNTYTYGGFFGIKILGAMPKAGTDSLGPKYYDQAVGLIDDTRGGFGLSDLLMEQSSIYGPEHTSRYRVSNIVVGQTSTRDIPVAGAYFISGANISNASGAIQGHRYISVRFSSWEACRIYLGYTIRDTFFGCMNENHSNGALDQNGNPITAGYGPVLRHPLASRTKTYACSWTGIDAFHSPATPLDAVVVADDGKTVLPQLEMLDGKISLRSESNGNAEIRTDSGAITFQNSTNAQNNEFRFKQGSLTLGSISPSAITFNLLDNSFIGSGGDNLATIGQSSRRLKTGYFVNSPIVTSDATHKTDVRPFSETELLAAEALSAEPGIWQWLDKVATEGDSARLHCGMTVQRAIEVISGFGLDPMRYNFICYNKWPESTVNHPAVYEEIERYDEENGDLILEKGDLISEAWDEIIPSGEIYSFREFGLIMFMMAGIRYSTNKDFMNFEKRLSALESK